MQHTWYKWLLLGFLLSGSISLQAQEKRYTFSRPMMGTEVRIVLYAKGSPQAQFAADLAFAHMDSLNGLLSDYVPESELNRLSKSAGTGEKFPVSEDVWLVLSRAQQLSEASEGAFDITIGPLSRLWRRAFRQQTFPDSLTIADTRELVNFRWIKMSEKNQTIQLKKADMKLDLGGIAKGYIAQEGLRMLRTKGLIQAALVDAGGDVSMMGPPPGRPGWEIALPDLDSAREVSQGRAIIGNGSIATSGDTYQFLEYEGVRYSHIIDPRSGLGITTRRLVTVWHQDGLWADAWASVLSIVNDPVDLLTRPDLPSPKWVQIIWEHPKAIRRWQWGTPPALTEE
ncbi:MAG: FAD:protein FMN transferase [Bacteroidota bacterium]